MMRQDRADAKAAPAGLSQCGQVKAVRWLGISRVRHELRIMRTMQPAQRLFPGKGRQVRVIKQRIRVIAFRCIENQGFPSRCRTALSSRLLSLPSWFSSCASMRGNRASSIDQPQLPSGACHGADRRALSVPWRHRYAAAIRGDRLRPGRPGALYPGHRPDVHDLTGPATSATAATRTPLSRACRATHAARARAAATRC